MELNREEVLVVEHTIEVAKEIQRNELCDLQLVFVGGGIGETTL